MTKLLTLKLLSFLLLTFSLTACTRNTQSSIDSLNAILDAENAPDILEAHIRSLPYPAVLVTINDRKPILMVLTFVDSFGDQNSKHLTWYASDGGSIITENGRIIQTTGFNTNNLENLSGLHTPPPSPLKAASWQAIYDWSPHYRYHFSADVSTQSIEEELITTFLWEQNTKHVTERVSFTGLGQAYRNEFWIAPATQTTKAFTIKSIQYIGPNMDKIHMLMIRPYVEPINTTSP
ncbi:YjbF family lipoprotein [Marinomonas sp. TW1]|uniref:YjbF family lipoprotein n=1 Tax=Marinomonas sp. TW1 TaxID=1561203 RepID=UPI0007AF82AA|nr:YjbF family lipoprotein [Marinomonas sp. TW1]